MFMHAWAMAADRRYRLGFQRGFQMGRRIWLLEEVDEMETLLEQGGNPLTAEQLSLMHEAVDVIYPPLPEYRGWAYEVRWWAWGFGIDLLRREPGAPNDNGFRWPEQLASPYNARWALRKIATPEQRDILYQNAGGV